MEDKPLRGSSVSMAAGSDYSTSLSGLMPPATALAEGPWAFGPCSMPSR